METDQRGAFLKIIVNESERLGRLVQQVLDAESLNQPGATGPGGAVAPVDVVSNLLEALNGLKILAHQQQTSLTTTVPSEPLYVRIPADRFRQIIVNLIGNALKFVPTNGTGEITVTLRELPMAEGVLELVVRDNGPGVPQDQAELIFDQFAQVHDRERGKPSGSGLGLFISRKIAEQAGGSLRLDLGYQEGAGFILRLPATNPTATNSEK